MGDMSEFSLTVRLFLKAYPWRRTDPVPWTPLRRPLADSRFALVSTSGFVAPGQTPFDDAVKGGDWSHREIPGDTDPRRFTECHRSESFDHAGIRADPNLAFPLDRARELVAAGRVGALNRRHFSVMGSITATGRFQKETAPAIATALAADAVDAALLVPV
jgi:D-proline reductase (dithiol) PrdB